MKAIECKSKITDRSIKIPENIEMDKLIDKDIKVILLYEEAKNDDFKILTSQQFFKGYDDSDSVYDEV
jgi:hypothetical protein